MSDESMSDRHDQLRQAILGAGGVGGLIGASLAHFGASVTLVVRRETLADYPQRLKLESPFGQLNVPVSVSAEVPAVDVLWLTVKATQLNDSLRAITNPGWIRAIVPLLNGIDHISLLRSRYGADKVIPATIAVESERVAPGHIIHRSPFARLNVSSVGRLQLEGTTTQLQQLGFECRFVDDEPTLMWSKLVFLAAFALCTTASGKTTGEILADPEWARLGVGCIRETAAVAVSEGAHIDADSVLAAAVKMPGNMRSSMQKDVERGKAPELDAIAGPILRGAQRHGIEVPATKKLVEMVEQHAGLKQTLPV
jgi:2-dehydropantoate 2-reductase